MVCQPNYAANTFFNKMTLASLLLYTYMTSTPFPNKSIWKKEQYITVYYINNMWTLTNVYLVPWLFHGQSIIFDKSTRPTDKC